MEDPLIARVGAGDATPDAVADSKFLKNSTWSVIGVTANIFVGIFLSPYIVRLLGQERFGIWSLVFALLDYLWLFDLGLTPAVANLLTRHLARKEPVAINEVINTAMCYFAGIALLLWLITATLGPGLVTMFKVPAAYRRDFTGLILMTGMSWGICVVLQMYVAALDAFQRFDLTNRVTMLTVLCRSTGYVLVLALGGGLMEVGAVYVISQLLGSLLHARNFASVFPALRFSPRFVKWPVFREILSYGIPAFFASGSGLLLNQSAPMMIGHFLPTVFVGFFALPLKLVQNVTDIVSRIALVTRSRVAELDANAKRRAVAQLAIDVNRYCFAVYMPFVIVLGLFGKQLIRLWLGEQFAEHSAPLLPLMLISSAFVLGGQYNSSAVLFGLGEHRGYARLLACEGAISVTALFFVVPRFGIFGAACVVSGLMIAVRGIVTPVLVCRTLDVSFVNYMTRIYFRPAATAIAIGAPVALIRHAGLRGTNWTELAMIGAGTTLLYGTVALLTCLTPTHRKLVLSLALNVARTATS
ncbi:MAG: polysaccharide biosynthesis protein [Candidatus Solibacter sp.]|nr:polysaccharide biosynthesis protein [Candidatus Solibacter sp.]